MYKLLQLQSSFRLTSCYFELQLHLQNDILWSCLICFERQCKHGIVYVVWFNISLFYFLTFRTLILKVQYNGKKSNNKILTVLLVFMFSELKE